MKNNITRLDNKLTNQYNSTRVAAISFAVSFSVLLLYYIAYYPGYFSPDSVWQYNQALNNSYNDWHPVLGTLLYFKLPLLLSGGWIGAPALFQILVFAVVLSYMVISICKYTSIKYAGMVLAFILLNPTTGMMALYVGKDTCFSICVLYLVTSALHIHFTDGLWMKRICNTILFIVVLIIANIVRHNAILFIIPFLIAVCVAISSSKKRIVIVVSFVLMFALIKYPIYGLINVEDGEKRQSEMMGLPMNVIAAVVAYNPDSLDEDILQFAYSISPKEVWENNYHYGSFNAIKFGESCNTDIIDNYPVVGLLNMTLRCIKSSPGVALTALYKTTCTVYSVTDDYVYNSALIPYDSKIDVEGIPTLQSVLDKYRGINVNALPHIFMYSGMMLLLLVLFILVKCKLNKWEDWKKILLVLPVFVYNYGTMLLLTSVWDGVRFFYYTFLVTPVLLIIITKNKNKRIDI